MDDLMGEIVGTMYAYGFLSYQGRKQGQTIYAESVDKLIILANDRLKEMKADPAFDLIYNDTDWCLKIVQG